MPKLSSVSCAVFQPNDQPCQGYFHQKLKVFPIRYWSIIFTLVCVWSSPASDTNQYGLVNGWPTDAHLRITQMSNGKYERFQEGTAQVCFPGANPKRPEKHYQFHSIIDSRLITQVFFPDIRSPSCIKHEIPSSATDDKRSARPRLCSGEERPSAGNKHSNSNPKSKPPLGSHPKHYPKIPTPSTQQPRKTKPTWFNLRPNKLLNKLRKKLRDNWMYYLKRVVRKVVSMLVTNAAAGNNLKLVNLSPLVNIASLELPANFTSPDALWTGMGGNRPSDEGDVTRLLDQIISWAPIGPLVHRAEVDLNYDLQQVLNLFFVTPHETSVRLSSDVKTQLRSVAFDQSQPPGRSLQVRNPRRKYLFNQPATNRKSSIINSNKYTMTLRTNHNPPILQEVFDFWLSSVIRHIHPFEKTSWIALCPSYITKSNPKIPRVPCVVTFSNEKKDQIQSIVVFNFHWFQRWRI